MGGWWLQEDGGPAPQANEERKERWMFRYTMGIAWMVLLLAVGGVGALSAADARVRLDSAVDMDAAGRGLRQAVTAYEQALESGLPMSYTRLTLERGETLRLGGNTFIVLLDGGDDRGAPVLLVTDDGPIRVDTVAAREVEAGPVKLIFLMGSRKGSFADFLVRGARDEAPMLANATNPDSKVLITGDPATRTMRIAAGDEQIVDFARQYLAEVNKGRSAEEAARVARMAVPPSRELLTRPTRGAAGGYTDPKNFFSPSTDDLPYAAAVTLQLVRGDSSSINELASSWAYDSSRPANPNPPVRVEGGGQGLDVDYGRPGDRFNAKLRAMEASGRVNVDSETFVRVPIGGYSDFSLQGGASMMSARMEARRAGRSAVMLEIDNRTGDWGFLGAVATRVRMRDGQTITLAKNSYSRTTEQSSGVPLARDIPFVGPVFGQERRTSDRSSFALFATLSLE